MISAPYNETSTRPREQAQETLQEASEQTLRAITENWFELKKEQVSSDYAEDVWRSFVLHVFPGLGDVPIMDITAPMVIEVLRPLEAKGTLETLKRVTQRLNEAPSVRIVVTPKSTDR